MSIKTNTTSLQDLLEQVNNLPNAGGVELPELSNPATATEVFANKELIDADGNKIVGTFTIENELTIQDDLIAQIQAAVDSLPEAGSGNGGSGSGNGGSGSSGNGVEIVTLSYTITIPAAMTLHYTDDNLQYKTLSIGDMNGNTHGSISVVKNSIVATTGGSYPGYNGAAKYLGGGTGTYALVILGNAELIWD